MSDFAKVEQSLREEMTRIASSFFQRGYATGSAGNLSLLLPDGNLLATPTGSCLGNLDPQRLSKVAADGEWLSGDKPSKEVLFHLALYRNNPRCKAVVHLHSTWSTALSCLQGLDSSNVIAISIPVGIVGYFAAKIINTRQYAMSVEVLEQMQLAPASEEGATKLSDKINPPGVALVTSLIVIPIAIIMAGTVSATLMPPSHPLLGTLQLIGSPMVALMIALVLAFWLLALRRGWSLQHTSDIMGSALPTAAVVILVTGAGGVFGKVLVESGVGKALANMLQMIDLPLLPAAFIISLALRASQGSATVAILTTGGLLSEAVMGLNPIQCVLVTLAACFGGLGASHINDSGFWIVTKYLGLSVADGLKTWTVLTTILGFTGFLITWCVWAVI